MTNKYNEEDRSKSIPNYSKGRELYNFWKGRELFDTDSKLKLELVKSYRGGLR
jgi:hypothetical protein